MDPSFDKDTVLLANMACDATDQVVVGITEQRPDSVREQCTLPSAAYLTNAFRIKRKLW